MRAADLLKLKPAAHRFVSMGSPGRCCVTDVEFPCCCCSLCGKTPEKEQVQRWIMGWYGRQLPE